MLRELLLVLVRVHVERGGGLAKVARADRDLRLLPRRAQCREEDRNQHGDDANDNQQFNQREPEAMSSCWCPTDMPECAICRHEMVCKANTTRTRNHRKPAGL